MEQKTSISPYAEYRKSDDIHGTALYPGVMVAPVQRDILKEYMPSSSGVTVCDPFMGSGTALYEAAALNSKVSLLGSDINPLAVFISKVKLAGVCEESVKCELQAIRSCLSEVRDDAPIMEFYNRDKWFKPEIARSLTAIHNAVSQIKDDRCRCFFWYMMIDIVRKYCNSRSSTYKLHVRVQSQIDNIENGVIADYLKKIDEEYHFFLREDSATFTLNQGDSISYLKGLDDGAVDICITSPPYGDNETTIPYGQYSALAMSWINPEDLNLAGWELEGYAAIDSRSLGGWRHEASSDDRISICDDALSEQIESICEKKQLKVKRFMRGYQQFLDEASRVTKRTMVFTLGNRTVDGVNIDLAGFTQRYLDACGWSVEERMRRPIKHKRTPSSVSRVNGKPVASMKEEIVLVASSS